MTHRNRLDDFLRWRDVDKLEAGQSQAEVARWLQVARKWSLGYGINSKQVVPSSRRSAKASTEQYICGGSLLCIERTAT
ncbi:hypothetical protein TNCV_3030141 [Trichonephila clavipes]|nr:hypothetical protein TNCV_3030141 [Trichonephila clavipes]